MEGYRLRSSHGDTIDPRQPLPVDDQAGKGFKTAVKTITYNGKAAAGAITILALNVKPIASELGDRVGSYWGLPQNRVFHAFADGKTPKGAAEWLRSVTETAGAAVCVIFDPNRNLEEMFESVTGTVKRFVVRVTDTGGNQLYGWIRGVSVSTNEYTFEVFNNRSTEGNQNWVGTLADFDNTALREVEIFHYTSSLSFGTGTTLTEEVECPKEYSKSLEAQMEFARTLSDGQFFVDYQRGEIIGPKADTTASEVLTFKTFGIPTLKPVGITKSTTVLAGAVPLSATSLPVEYIDLQAPLENTDNVYIGPSTLDAAAPTAAGTIVLVPGGSVRLQNVDLADVYMDVSVDNEDVTGLGFR